jgi:DNA invertase Pin-like site-specific DNA recombinase
MPHVYSYCRLPLSGDVAAYRAGCLGRVQQYASEHLPGLPVGELFGEHPAMRKRPFGNRPEATRLKARLEAGDHVVIVDSALAFTNWPDLLQQTRLWEALRVHVHYVDLGADSVSEDGQWALTVLGQFVKAQSRRRAEETWAGVKKRKRQAEPNGRPPYPYRLAGPKGSRRRVLDRKLRQIGKKIVALKEAGRSFDAIYFELLAAGCRDQTRGGIEYSRTRIQDIHRAELALQQQEATAQAAQPSRADSAESF